MPRSTGPLFEPVPAKPGAVDMHVRSYRVEYRQDFRREMAGWDWRLYTYGRGHWCEGTGHSATFQTEADARAAGHRWVVTGRDQSAKVTREDLNEHEADRIQGRSAR